MKQTNGVAGVILNPNSSAPQKPLTFVHPIPNNSAYVALYAQPDLHHLHYEGVGVNPMEVVGIVPAGASFSAFRPIQQQRPVQPVLAPNQLYAVQTSHSSHALPHAISVQNKFIITSNPPLQSHISPQPVLVATTLNESGPRPQHPPIASRSFPIDLFKISASSLSAPLRPPPAERQSIPPSYDATLVALQSGQAVVRSARSTLRNRRISPSSSSSNNSPRTRNDVISVSFAPASASNSSGLTTYNSQETSLGISSQNGQHTRGTNASHAKSGVPVRPRSDSVGANRAHRGPQEEEARKNKLAEVAQQLSDLKQGLRELRRAHVRIKEEADESLLAFRRTMRALLVELPAASRTPLRRERLAIDQELGEIRRDQTSTLSTLGEVEDAVGEVRQSLIASHEARVQMPLSAVEIEAYILQLGRVVSALSSAERRFFSQDKSASESTHSTPSGASAVAESGGQQQRSREQELNGGQQERSLATRCNDLWVSEMEIIVEEERFLKTQPETLGNALQRCKQIGRVLLTLKKIAQVQQSQAQLSAVRSAVADALRLETNPTPTHADKQLVLDNIQALLPNSEQRLHAINESEEHNRRRKKFLAEYERLQMEKLLGAQRRNFRPERDRGANRVPAGDARSAAHATSRVDDRTTSRGHLSSNRANNPHNTTENTNAQEGTATIMESFDEDAESLRKLDALFNELDTMLEDLDKLSTRPRNHLNSTNDSNSREQNGSGSDESDYDNFNSLGSPTARNESNSAHTSAEHTGDTLPEEQTSDSNVQSETMASVESVANAGGAESDVPVAGKHNSANGKRVKTLKGIKKSIWNPFRLIRFGSAQTINKAQSASNRSEGEEVSSSSNSSSAETVVLVTTASSQPVTPNKAAAGSAAQPKNITCVPQATSAGASRKSQSLSTMGRRPSDSSFSRGDRSLSFPDPESH